MKKGNYKKKKETIKKKTRELSILCDVKACAILVGPNGEVDTWPENPTELNPIIQSYKQCIVDGRKSKVKVEDDVVDGGGCLKKKSKNNHALFCDNGGDDQWIRNLSKESKESLLVKLNLKLEAVEKRIEFLKMVNNGHGVVGDEIVVANQETHTSDFAINGDQLRRGNEVVVANQETHNSDFTTNGDQLRRGKEVVGGNQENCNSGFDEFWVINGDQFGNSVANYNQGTEIVMAAEFWGTTNGDQLRDFSVYDQCQGVDFWGHEEMNMWETLSDVQNFGCDDIWSIINVPEFDLLPQEATGFGTALLNQQTLANDSFKPNYDYSHSIIQR